MQSKNIYELLELFLKDGFTVENLCEMTGVSCDLIRRCINHEKITQDEILILEKVLSFLGLLYMVDTDDVLYLKESVSALEQFYLLPNSTIANYLRLNHMEFESFLENPKDYPNGYNLMIKLMHFKTVLLQK